MIYTHKWASALSAHNRVSSVEEWHEGVSVRDIAPEGEYVCMVNGVFAEMDCKIPDGAQVQWLPRACFIPPFPKLVQGSNPAL